MAGPGLRVHGGEARGRRLTAPPGIRPSQGMVKEAIFNHLAGAVVGARVLDLCAGSGALGIEALSRGAAHVTFVDRGERPVAAIRRNLGELGYPEQAAVVRADVGRWLPAHAEEVAAADVALIDPPYNDPVLGRSLVVLDRLCGSDALVVVEHGWRQRLPVMERLAALFERRYGDTQLTVLASPRP
jgi:16S rRNA (guanine966-N2)-methyltransferase